MTSSSAGGGGGRQRRRRQQQQQPSHSLHRYRLQQKRLKENLRVLPHRRVGRKAQEQPQPQPQQQQQPSRGPGPCSSSPAHNPPGPGGGRVSPESRCRGPVRELGCRVFRCIRHLVGGRVSLGCRCRGPWMILSTEGAGMLANWHSEL